MNRRARFGSFLRTLLFRRRGERDMAREWAFHLDARVDDLVTSGMPRAEAERRARQEFGDPLRWQEQAREVRGVGLLDDLRQDAAYAVRQMRRTPGFTVVAVLTLALGIGANTAIFSVVNAVLLRPLPYPDSERIVRIWSEMPARGVPRSPSALPDYYEWRERSQSFDEMAAYHSAPYNMTGRSRPVQLVGVRLTASMWTVLQAAPAAGSLFAAESEQWGRHRVAVLSHRAWQRHFGGDAHVIGQTVTFDDEAFVVLGVMPPSFGFPNVEVDVWTPIAFPAGDSATTRSNRFVSILGRLKAGTSAAQAQADLSTIAGQISRAAPENAGVGVGLQSWRELIVGNVRVTLWLLLGAVAVVALIACANVANLLLARASSRQQELAVRLALGAGRARLFRQLLTESAVLAGLGALVGWIGASLLLQALPNLAASGIPRITEITLDRSVLAFAGGLTVLTTIVFGLWPAWHSSAAGGVAGATTGDLRAVVSAPRGASPSRATVRARSLLIVAEVSCALVLLVGVGLLTLSVINVQHVNPGFRIEQLLTMQVSLPAVRYDRSEKVVGFIDEITSRAGAVAGVTLVGATTALPLGQSEWGKYLTLEGQPTPPSLAEVPTVRYRQVTAGYFAALGATVRRGRPFAPDDRRGQPGVAIVNETAARRLWPGRDPVGTRVSLGAPEALVVLPADFVGGIEAYRQLFPFVTVVGVVDDLRHNGQEQAVEPEVFVPYAQGAGEDASGSFYVVARTAADPMRYATAVEAAIHDVDRNQPVTDIQSMAGRFSESLARRRFTLTLLGGFGATAVALALVGLYGVMAYTVTQRRREMGIRLALGAAPRDIAGLVIGQGLRLVVGGIALGLTCAALLSRALASLLFDVPAIHPAIYALTALLLFACAALACWVPSRRAAHVDPIAALRES